jgi:excinuclease ABC subunit C
MDCGVAGLAKRDEEIWLPGAREPLRLSRRSEALKVLQFVRDETHRFATGLNQKLRSKDLSFPVLESLEGVGPKRAAAIMKAYESIESIAAAGYKEIAKRCGIPETAAKAVQAAAKLALENRKTAKKQFASGTSASRRRPRAGYSGKSAEDLADEAFAAEKQPGYEGGR